MYDFAVVGAGPAGSRFARRAAEAGHDVVVLEKGTVGQPLACSGHVSRDLWDYLPDGARDRLLQNEVLGARFHVDGPGSRAYPFYKDRPVSNVIDRVGLDRELADLAREAGAEIRTNHRVTGIEERGDRVTVDVAGTDGTETDGDTNSTGTGDGTAGTVDARMVAGADGPVSTVRSELGLPDPGELLHGVLGFDPDPDHGDFVDVHLTAPRFFAWRIPRGDAGVEYGIAAPPGGDRSARELFDDFVAGYDVAVENVCSGAIPVGPPGATTAGRGFLLGDAAGQTKPFTGGGILYGMTAADHAAREVDPANPETLADYEAVWRDDLAREIRLGRLVRRCYSLPTPLQRVGLRALSGEIGVHMDRPSTLFSPSQLRALLSRS